MFDYGILKQRRVFKKSPLIGKNSTKAYLTWPSILQDLILQVQELMLWPKFLFELSVKILFLEEVKNHATSRARVRVPKNYEELKKRRMNLSQQRKIFFSVKTIYRTPTCNNNNKKHTLHGYQKRHF